MSQQLNAWTCSCALFKCHITLNVMVPFCSDVHEFDILYVYFNSKYKVIGKLTSVRKDKYVWHFYIIPS